MWIFPQQYLLLQFLQRLLRWTFSHCDDFRVLNFGHTQLFSFSLSSKVYYACAVMEGGAGSRGHRYTSIPFGARQQPHPCFFFLLLVIGIILYSRNGNPGPGAQWRRSWLDQAAVKIMMGCIRNKVSESYKISARIVCGYFHSCTSCSSSLLEASSPLNLHCPSTISMSVII